VGRGRRDLTRAFEASRALEGSPDLNSLSTGCARPVEGNDVAQGLLHDQATRSPSRTPDLALGRTNGVTELAHVADKVYGPLSSGSKAVVADRRNDSRASAFAKTLWSFKRSFS
jgi:hypothetical protein